MRNLSFLYYLVMFLLASFATAFFLTPSYMPDILEWKAHKLLERSQAYKSDELINTIGLMETGIQQAKIAMLLAPDDIEVTRNYVELLSQTDPHQAILEWERMLRHPNANLADREKLVRHCLNIAQDRVNGSGENLRALAMIVAKRQLLELVAKTEWGILTNNMLLRAEFLAEAGKPIESLKIVTKLLKQTNGNFPAVTFLYAKLATHLGNPKHLGQAGRLLADLALRSDETGLEAIRHITLIHTALPLATEGLEHCRKLLHDNPKSKPIDFLRLHALRFDSAKQDHERAAILQESSELFDLEDNRELEIYCRWLGRLQAFPRMLKELPPTRSRLDENLFKLRMNALAVLERHEDMKNELANAPAISRRWRLAISARVFALSGDFNKAAETLDQLLDELGKDTRLLLSTCRYLEVTKDIRGLCHILEKLIDEPGIKRYALEKLLEYQASSAPLADLRYWISKLRSLHIDDPRLHNAELYFQLLDSTISQSEIASIAKKANGLLANNNEHSFRITAALAHLLNENPDKALLALGDLSNWRVWQETRPAWIIICAQTFRRNQDTQTAKRLESKIALEKMDLAERQSLALLFPESFPHSPQ